MAPLVAGLSGLAWFWFELEPQRRGFEDTDNPAVGLQFIAAYPQAWALAGIALAIAAIALVIAVLAMHDRLAAARPAGSPAIIERSIMVLGLLAAAFLLGQAATRLAGGPVAYVQGLDQGWGETAYLVTQFVGIQLFGVGGLALLAVWTTATAWVAVRRGALPMLVGVLAVVPALRLVGVAGVLGLSIDGLWFPYMLAIPGTFLWLIVLGVSLGTREPAAHAQAHPVPI